MKKKPAAKKPATRKATLPATMSDPETGKPFEATKRKSPPTDLSNSERLRWIRENR